MTKVFRLLCLVALMAFASTAFADDCGFRGALDTAGVANRKQSRSLYGAKKSQKQVKKK